MSAHTVVKWAAEPAPHDYPAAASYLRLIVSPTVVDVLTALLSQAPTVQQHAKDVLRAAGLALLPSYQLDEDTEIPGRIVDIPAIAV